MNTQPNSARTCRKCGTVEFSKKLCSPPLFQLGCRCGVGMDEALPWDEACDVWNAMDREQPRACNCCGTQPELIERWPKRFVYKCPKCQWWGPVASQFKPEQAAEYWNGLWGI